MGAQTSAECFQCGEKRPRPEKEGSVDDAASLAPSDFSAEVMNQYRTESSDTTDRLFVENSCHFLQRLPITISVFHIPCFHNVWDTDIIVYE